MKNSAEAPQFESLDAVIQHYCVDPSVGLSEGTVADRIKQFGANQMRGRKSHGLLTIVIRQFQGTVILLLVFAAAISYVSHEVMQAAGIMIAVVINAVIGFITEWQAKVSLDKLEALAGPTARVLRAGHEQEIPAHRVVPGDIAILEPGARVPADLRLIDSYGLSIDESSMSGESVPVFKSATNIGDDDPDAQIALQGTLILAGRGRGVVTATGDQTRLGHLGCLLTEAVSRRTPLEEKLEELGRQLTVAIFVLCSILAAVGIWHQEDVWMMIQTAIALAVAAIPEGMPVVATLALAVGTQRMVHARALVRQLGAVETLGCTTIICSDKTGTLTENQMVLTDLVCNSRHLKLSGAGYEPKGEITEDGLSVSASDDGMVVDLLRAAALCNDAKIENHDGGTQWHVHGDPTEGALIAAAGKVGLVHDHLVGAYPRTGEIPFDLERKRMSTVHRTPDGGCVVYTKGSPESVMKRSCFVRIGAGDRPLTDLERDWFINKNDELAKLGLRVLAIAHRKFESEPAELTAAFVETDLTLLGLVGMSDRPREGVQAAIESCKNAGIKVIMVTGDQPATAQAIARDLNLLDPRTSGDPVLTGSELSKMNESELRLALRDATVLARVTPEMKLAVVRALQADGEIVAMTGDGVNDAPALRQSNIGVAMGRSGTALAREASSMVITDDNFATMIKAIRQGRIIYANIRKSIAYLLTASVASVMCVAGAVLFDIGLVLTPLQLLWLNLIMHVFPGLGIVLQRGDSDVMTKPPRSSSEHLLSRVIKQQIGIRSIVVACAVLFCLYLHVCMGGAVAHKSTIGLATLSLALLLQALSWSGLGMGKAMTNMPMIVNLGISGILLMAAIYAPVLQGLLNTVALNATEMLLVVLGALCSAIATGLIMRLPVWAR